MMDGDEVIASIYRKIERENALIQAASNMRQSTDNPLVQQRVDTNIREGRKNIQYLEEKMRELQMRRLDQGGSPGQRKGPGPTPPPKDGSGYFGNEGDGYQSGPGGQPTGAPYADPRPNAPIPKARPNYTKLGTFPRSIPRLLDDTVSRRREKGANFPIGMLTSFLFQI